MTPCARRSLHLAREAGRELARRDGCIEEGRRLGLWALPLVAEAVQIRQERADRFDRAARGWAGRPRS